MPGRPGVAASRRVSRERAARAPWLALASATLAACLGSAEIGGAGTVSVSPASVSLTVGDVHTFHYSATDATDLPCDWSVREGAPGGTIDSGGTYTAPDVAGTYHVVATSRARPGRSATGAVQVTGRSAGVSVVVTPRTPSLKTGATVQLTASVTGTSDAAVTWTVQEGAAGGQVSASGLYTAPGSAGTYHAVATSHADPTRSDAATLTVTADPSPTVAVVVSPRTKSLSTGGTLQLSATVTGTTNVAVTWAIQEGAAGGQVSASGLYTAPGSAGTYHVVATSQADGAARDTATITVTSGTCSDACAAPNGGITWTCEKRFMLGVNWAWGEWGADFGGIAAWNKPGVKAGSARFDADMKAMKAAGVSVIRWWMWPRFLTDSISWGADGSPSGIGGTLMADVEEALRLAEVNDLYLMLTPFSFDNFGPTTSESGITSRGMKAIVQSAALRRKLLDNLVKPVAQAVEASPYRKRMIAWDMINEPEWALTGASLWGDPSFEPSSKLEPVSHAELQTFLQEMAAVLRASSTALVTIGGAAIKWPKAWSHVDVDFYQFHYYDWVYQWFPYTTVTPASVGVTDKPVVVGEFPAAGLSAIGGHPARTAAEYEADLWALGYAGALAWAYNDPGFPWRPAATSVLHGQHGCETAY
jgi:hypothetical protein